MNFNLELYKEYRRKAGKDEKDGFWDVRRFPNGKYCFATNQWLGDNGKIDNHPMLNKKFKRLNKQSQAASMVPCSMSRLVMFR